MGMNSVNSVDYVVIGLYALLMVLVGLYVMRFNRGAAEYFRGGSRIPWLVAGLSCFMSGFSAWTFTGAAGVAYRVGDSCDRALHRQRFEFSARIFCFCPALAAEPHYHRDGISCPGDSIRPPIRLSPGPRSCFSYLPAPARSTVLACLCLRLAAFP